MHTAPAITPAPEQSATAPATQEPAEITMQTTDTAPEEIDADDYGTNRATFCMEDNKLRLYVGRVPRDEYEALRVEGWTSTPKQDCDFVAIWTPARRDRALSYAGIIEDEDASPAERAADRAERFAGYREKRTAEAIGSADRYDSQPSAYGFQSQARAERAARRHDGHAARAVDSWSKAEYWQSRTAGVISHALHVSTPSVRMGRIKELELAIARHERHQHETEWTTHYRLRLAYENQMLEAQGGRASLVEMEAGGWLGKHQIFKVTRSPVTKLVVSVELRYMSECNRWGRPWSDGKGSRLVSMLYNIERLPSTAYRPPTEDERAAFKATTDAAKKGKADAAKEKRDAGENCPLVNPTDADAERIQALWNNAAQAQRDEAKKRYGYGSEFIPAKVVRMTQDRYSYLSKGSGYTETTGICANGERQARNTFRGQEDRKRQGPALCKLRIAHNSEWHTPYSVIIITDKPQKPLPAKVWQPLQQPTANTEEHRFVLVND